MAIVTEPNPTRTLTTRSPTASLAQRLGQRCQATDGGSMRFSRRTAVAVVGAVALFAAAACSSGNNGGGSTNKKVEVFTWWADGGEKAGLDGLVGVFKTACSQYTFENGAIAGGAGSNAKTVLPNRLQKNQPPDTFQAHAGAELTDYINAGQIEDLSQEYRDWGLTSAFPSGLISNLTVDS